ncbi:MAG: hypothetical protein IJN25_03680 [Clostridia bacterium]|nr:hypothetical protein [Oscillospiraceae bacterium]MBQ7032744.1 hypothetical protein [Clostridia bacterium]
MFKYSIALKNFEDETYGIDNLELCDGVFGKPLHCLSGAETEDIRNRLIARRQRIVLYSVDIPTECTADYIAFFRRAHLLGIENVLLCAPGNENLATVIDMARGMGIRLLFEPTKENGLTFDAYKEIRTPDTGLVLSSVEFSRQGIMPFRSAFYKSKVHGDVVFVRMKDGIMGTDIPVPLEEGNSEVKECLSILLARSFTGYISVSDYCGNMDDTLRRLAEMLTNI